MYNNGLNESIEALKNGFSDDKLKQIATFPQRFGSLTCADAVRILKYLSFEDDQIKALEYIAPVIVDKAANQTQVVNCFSFSSGKDKALSLLNQPAPQPAYPQQPMPQPGYPQPGYPQPGYYPPAPAPAPTPCNYQAEFDNFMSQLKSVKFAVQKLEIMSKIKGNLHMLTCENILTVFKEFKFAVDKMSALRQLACFICDKNNSSVIVSCFKFGVEKSEAAGIIAEASSPAMPAPQPAYPPQPMPQPAYPQPAYPQPARTQSPPRCSPHAGISVGFPGMSISTGVPGMSVSAGTNGMSVSAGSPSMSVSAGFPGMSISANVPQEGGFPGMNVQFGFPQ